MNANQNKNTYQDDKIFIFYLYDLAMIGMQLWFKHIYFITSIHSTYTQYITGGLGWKQKLIRTLFNAALFVDIRKK